MTRILMFVSVFLCAGGAIAGEYNKVLKIGDPAPSWKNLPGVDGQSHSLADLKDQRAIVVVFTCNSCPVAVDYENRIIEFAKKYRETKSGVAVVAINVNTIEADRLPKMKERAKEKKFPFAYLFDESQKIAKEYGAVYTPEFFVLDAERKIAYMGAMDEKGPPAGPGTRFLEEAVEAVLQGKTLDKKETLARGCRIRYERPKR